ncbi:MAG: molybdenum cofactor guanylyltransferase MobA [Hydrogenophaga sp.]|uniref:Molybdenum cofactor guanylyltransferase n=1 Tax=Hydrogenophaga crocea TaxID=2716225 RepID=A0A6G8IG13_9BURK|nr:MULTISPECIES: molybdenum cofactor guanylyltransferase MobA [Hydrogenophaga]MBL0945979.1 molybdenum cofactor guanylyltransferase MobA [Hydrogenophaga sp.]QIM52051.1 molybdenum cofactor guanylyltransferase MobA [Hydrogenophaga crocea]
MIGAQEITAMVLAGGRGSRMGGADKGLQKFNGTPLALNALMRLQVQQGGLLGELMLNANRNLGAYEAFGVPVWPDTLSDYAGPLAGFLTGLERAELPYLLTVPCDVPRFPLDLVQRLAQAFDDPATEIAMVSAPEDGQLRPQPVFCLMNVGLLESLVAFTQAGGRKIDRWTEQHRCVLVPFDRPGDDPNAFVNTNTLDELHTLEQSGS